MLQTKIYVKTIYLEMRKSGKQKPIESVIMIIARQKPPLFFRIVIAMSFSSHWAVF